MNTNVGARFDSKLTFVFKKMESKTQVECGPTRRPSTTKSVKVCPKEERNATLKKVSVILQKPEHERTVEEQQTLNEYSELVTDLKLRWQKRDEAKRRTEEVEEPLEVLQEKCFTLAKAIAQSEHLVIYTGAGISTAARIPDYRGTNGIWTRLQQGKEIENHDLSLAEPTYTHMALSELYHRKILKYIVSQNCDGLHLRSGLPRSALSELHGNMYIEVCKNCKPVREYWRLFDVTENTARFSHKTMRRCYVCSQELFDTIVHFGERGTLQWPLNWNGACKNADKADMILCIGSSLKVLKRYPWLWQMNKPAKKRPNLYIVNLQWTPKDESAIMKINGKCDVIMRMVMKYLNVEVHGYDREKDPIFAHATLLTELEMHTTTQPLLKGELNETNDTSSIKCETVIKDENIIKDEAVDHIKEEIVEISELKRDEEAKISIKEDVNINPYIYEEQLEAIDFSVSKTKNCDNTHSVNSRLIGNCSNFESNSTKRKSQDVINLPSKVSNKGIFTIDSILNNEPQRQNNVLMAYYELANTVFQNQMLNYVTSSFYPFQTSFLYPGIHSIINPVPYINYDFNSPEPRVIEQKPTCDFCNKTFNSLTCLYYSSTEPKFLKEIFRFSKIKNCNKLLVCVCCDYTTEEESDSDESTKKIIKNENSESENVDQTNIEKKIDGKIKIQAGWFGKGYRKNRRIKKR